MVSDPEHVGSAAELAAPPASSGWPLAFVDLYRARYLPMVRLAFLLTGSNPLAEEVVQDAFVRVHNALDRVDQPAAYLRTTVVNGCANLRRRQAVERRYVFAAAASTEPEADHLADALGRLPERQRAVLVLRYYEGLSELEIAEAIGCRPGTVKSTAARALAELRKVIER
jgi:RNA polymerase sigma-70 factor (sigma-E family)